jgi:CheY-like chemotaxis protein
LLGNARKFTRAGEVDLEVSLLSHTAFDVEFLFVVADTGIGIAPEYLGQIAEPYFQAAEGLNRRFSGTGLGLSIVTQLLEKMGSHLNISSTVGQGTVFDFSLKLAKLETGMDASSAGLHSLAQATGATAAVGLKFLYVEDSETNQMVMSAMMDRLGVNLMLASSAQAGFEVLQTHAIDVVITDIQMPEYSGLDLLAWIQKTPSLTSKLTVYACTANAGSDAVKEFEEAGFRGVLTKPLDLQALEQFLARL